jgi:hypothetical protein
VRPWRTSLLPFAGRSAGPVPGPLLDPTAKPTVEYGLGVLFEGFDPPMKGTVGWSNPSVHTLGGRTVPRSSGDPSKLCACLYPSLIGFSGSRPRVLTVTGYADEIME